MNRFAVRTGKRGDFTRKLKVDFERAPFLQPGLLRHHHHWRAFPETKPFRAHAKPTGQHAQTRLGWNRFAQQPLSRSVNCYGDAGIASIEFPRQFCRPDFDMAYTSQNLAQPAAESLSLKT